MPGDACINPSGPGVARTCSSAPGETQAWAELRVGRHPAHTLPGGPSFIQGVTRGSLILHVSSLHIGLSVQTVHPQSLHMQAVHTLDIRHTSMVAGHRHPMGAKTQCHADMWPVKKSEHAERHTLDIHCSRRLYSGPGCCCQNLRAQSSAPGPR